MKVTNKMQVYRLIYYSYSALRVSDDVFPHHQEHLTVFTQAAAGWCHGWVELLLIHDISRQQLAWILPDTVNTVKRSWWLAKTSPETCRAD